ncbi:MAG: DEAD/DEAH box helicase [Calditrichia bacterium]
MNNFRIIGVEDPILTAIEEMGFKNPMPVQQEVLPQIFNNPGQDIIALAQTGTGKTAAFGIPLIQNTDPALKTPQYLILSPTRELCLQITDDLNSFAKYKDKIKIAAVFGGASIDLQIKAIKNGAQIISATPGRLLDLINRRKVDLSQIRTVVLDEADEMLNMGFREELEAILEKTPADKNMLLFSATMPRDVRTMANRFMKKPFEIVIGKRNAGAENVTHQCYMVHAKDRYLALKRIVDFHPDIYGIVFCRTRRETQEVADKLVQDGYNADALHGDLSQAQRDAVMNKFRIKHLTLLVATDVAARGLDVEYLTHIINYNLPDDPQVYTHRSGRTGRAGRAGTSIVIANLKEKSRLRQIEKQLNKTFEYPPIPGGREICEKQLFHQIDRMEKVDVAHAQIESFLPQIFKKLEWLDREELIKKFVSLEFNRFLDYYKNTPDLTAPTTGKKGKRNDRPSVYSRFFLNLGKKDGIRPATLIGMINDFTGTRDIGLGNIEIMDNFSFFEADDYYSGLLMKSFKDKKFGKQKVYLDPAEEQSFSKRKIKSGKKRRNKSVKKF